MAEVPGETDNPGMVNAISCISCAKALFELYSGVLSSSEIFELHDALVYNVHIFFIIKPRVV